MNENVVTKSDKEDQKLSFTIIFFFIIQSANSSIKTILTNLGADINLEISILSGVLILVMLFISMRYVLKRHPSIVAKSYMLFLIVYLISIAMNLWSNMPINVLLKESMLWTMVWWLPMGLIIYSVRNKEILYRTLLKWSYLLSAITLSSLYAYFNSIFILQTTSGNYNMSFSYLLLLPLLMHLNEVFEKKSPKNVAWLAIEVVAILVYGTRAAIMCIAIFMFLKIVWGGQNAKKEMTVVVLSGLLVVAFIFGAAAFYEDLESAGYTSRTLEMFTSGTMSVSQGRDELRQFSLELIWERPVFGYGLGGEYAVLFEKAYGLSANSSNFSSLTPHNGILQLMMNFGILIGTLLSVVLIRSIFYIKKVKDRYTKTVLIILCSIYIIPSLTVGDGIFVKPGIALFVFLILNWYQNRKKIKKTSL